MVQRSTIPLKMLFATSFLALLAGLSMTETLQGQTDAPGKEVTTASGLRYTDNTIGTGDKVKVGTTVGVMYTGMFRNGEKFDSNIGKRPLNVTIGEGRVIKGWEEGLIGMQKGGKRKLIVPAKLGYGEAGKPPRIPPNTELMFELECVSVTNKQ